MKQVRAREKPKKGMDTCMQRMKPETSTIEAQGGDYAPVRILELELSCPLPTISAVDDKTGQSYRRARCLVRLHTQPLGIVELTLDKNELSPHDYVQPIWDTLNAQINEHLQKDGLPSMSRLDEKGIASPRTPDCLEERERFLADAPFVSIIVSTRDRPEAIQRCLRSLVSLHYPRYEVIVMDNAPSTNETADFIQQTYHEMPHVHYMREDHPGASWARNCGILAVKGEILAFTDDDVIVDPYWLLELVRGFSLADEVVCVTGLAMPLELETPAQYWFEDHERLNERFTQHIFDMVENHPKVPLYPYATGQFGTGSNMAFTAAFLRSVGGFDPALGPGSQAPAGEELALFFQVVTQGYKLVYTPASLLYHQHRRDYTSLRQQIYGYGVGVTAYLMKILLDNPRLFFDLVIKVPYGLYFSLSSRSPKNSKKSAHYPKELTGLELKGMLYGPFAYLQSRWHLRNAFKAPTPVEMYPPLSETREI